MESVAPDPTVNAFNAGKSARDVAVAALAATLVGRVVGPALHGARHGLDALIPWVDWVGAFATYVFAIMGVALLLRQITVVMQEQRLAAGPRIVASALAMVVVSLVLPAMLQTQGLPQGAKTVLATTAAAVALLGAREAASVPRSRALGVVLAAMAAAAVLHVAASWIFAYAGDRALYRLASMAHGFTAMSLLCSAVGLLTVLVWLSARNQARLTWSARIALVVTFMLAVGAMQGARDNAPFWQVLAYRALDRLHLQPEAPGPRVLAYFVESFPPILAAVALLRRHELPGIAGGFALALLAAGTPDVPLCALGLAIAGLSAIICAKDDKGLWSVLLNAPRSGS